MQAHKRILRNSVLLYVRMAIVMIVNLFSVRFILLGLGVEDYGIYNAVGGVVSMLACVSYALSTATQRYYSFTLGKNDRVKLQKVFSTFLTIFIVFSVIVIFLAETIGLWFVNNKMVIPENRMIAANWIYQFSILSFLLSIIQVPYSGAVFAHEDMGVYAILSIADCLIRFFLVLIIPNVPIDKLVYYGGVLLLLAFLNFLIYLSYAKRNYLECYFSFNPDKGLYKEVISFSVWSLWGGVAGTGMTQVNTILTNIFFGPLVNAARAIAFQINSIINQFTNNFVTAIRPPMIKSYADNDFNDLLKLFWASNKFIIYCLMLIFMPIYFEVDTILFYWLKVSDAQTILFSRLILIYSFILSLHNPITIIIQATGKVRDYHLWVEIPTLLCMPATYILFKIGMPAESAFWTMIIAISFSHGIRLWQLKKSFPVFSLCDYIKIIICPAALIIILVSTLNYIIPNLDKSLIFLFIRVLANILSISFFAYFIALNKCERKQLILFIKNKISRKNN